MNERAWTTPGQQQPAVAQPQACPACGAPGALVARSKELTTKKRSKFGLIWLLVTIFTGGFGLLLWLVWPRHTEVIGVDRFLECRNCKARV